MLKIRKLEVGQLKSNCYLVIDEKTNDTLIIDPGDDADYIMRAVSDEDAKPIKIIATHGHFDHVMATYELQLAYKIPFLMHKKDFLLLKNMQSSTKYFLGVDPGPPPKANENLTRTVLVKLGKHKFEVIETPGHTPGSVSLYCKKEKILFSGDLIFEGGAVGRTDFKYSNEKDLKESINRILKLGEGMLVYSGHGEPFYTRDFKKYFY